MSHLPFLPVLWQCGRQDPLVSAESIVGRRILLNKLGALKTTFYESLAFFHFRHSVDLDFNEEVKPERFTETLDLAGVNLDTIRVSKWYRKTTLKGEVSHFSSFSRTSDTFFETNLTSEIEPIEHYEERLAM